MRKDLTFLCSHVPCWVIALERGAIDMTSSAVADRAGGLV